MIGRAIKYSLHAIAKIPKSPVVFTSDLSCTLLIVCYVLWVHSVIDFNTFSISIEIASLMIFILITQAASYWIFGLYRGVWRFASLPDLMRIIKGCVTSAAILGFANYYLDLSHLMPYSSIPLFCLLSICVLGGNRLIYRWSKENHKILKSGKKVLVIGAGRGGESLLRELQRKTNKDFIPIGLIDDDISKLGLEIQGIRVLGDMTQLPSIVKNKEIELILLAIPRASSAEMRRVVSLCEQTEIPYRTLPSLNDILAGKATITTIRQVSVEDLLSRDPIQFDREQLMAVISHKKILVTGAGGSIGSELCRKIAEYNPECLILIEHSEFNLFKIQTELQQHFPNLCLYAHLISITHQSAINIILEQYQPDYLFHAAAYKHVPLLEPQISVAIDNNIFGTQILAEAAVKYKVKKFIFVSTDKAVNPNNIMGATKRCAELLCQCLHKQSATDFTTIRFGNVLDSTGSVVPLFKEQIGNGGPVTITHPDMERYFMTIQEAAQLIIQTVAIHNPNNLYVLDMGEPVKIRYLAEQMIKLAGRRPNVDIEITYCGLRPGEKINEELFYADENVSYSAHKKILCVQTPPINVSEFMQQFLRFKQAYLANDENLKKYLFDLANKQLQVEEEIGDEINNSYLRHPPMPLAVEYLTS